MNAFSRVFPTSAPATGGPSTSRHSAPFTKRHVAIAGVVVAVGAGLYSAHRTKKNGAGGSSSSNLSEGSYDASTGAIGTYDSTANDIYDALQPQVEAVNTTTAGIASLNDNTAALNTTLTGLPGALASSIQAALPKPATAKKPKSHKAAPKPKKPKAQPKATPKPSQTKATAPKTTKAKTTKAKSTQAKTKKK